MNNENEQLKSDLLINDEKSKILISRYPGIILYGLYPY